MRLFQRCWTVRIFDGSGPSSGSSSDFWKVMVLVPVPTFKKLWAGWFYTIIHVYVTDSWVLRAKPEIHRQNVDRVLGFFSSRPNWDTTTPSPAGVVFSLRERGWGVPISTRGQTLWYSSYLPGTYICTLCSPAFFAHFVRIQVTELMEGSLEDENA